MHIHMHLFPRLAGVLVALLVVPTFAFAASPEAVTGIIVEQMDEGMSVSWDPVPDETIAYYRVYYSGESILDNEGAYDDFEVTPGPENLYFIEVPPPVDVLYVTVLAVNEAGEESESFLEEASVEIAKAEPEEAETVEEPEEVTEEPEEKVTEEPEEAVEEESETAEPLRLLSADSTSATSVALLFSAPVVMGSDDVNDLVRITDSAGVLLPIISFDVDGDAMKLVTAEQAAGMVYEVNASPEISGKGGEILDDVFRVSFFKGAGKEVEPEPEPEPEVTPPPDNPRTVENLTLRAQQQPNGLFTVVGQWEYDNSDGGLAHYIVHQSRDKGKTLGTEEKVAPTMLGVRLENVDPGDFGIQVYTVNVYGNQSLGMFDSIYLPAAGTSMPPVQPSQPPVQAQVTPPPAPPAAGGLAQTGGGVALASIALAGAYLGWRKGKKVR